MPTRYVVAASAEVLLRLPEVVAALSPAELARADRFRRETDRRDFLAAHTLARWVAGVVVDRAPHRVSLRQRCAVCGGGGHGRPDLPDHPEVGVSWSHIAGVVAAAAGLGPVGIDVEIVTDRIAEQRWYETVLTAKEIGWVRRSAAPAQSLLRLWVRKESLIKVGLLNIDDMAKVDVLGDGRSTRPPARWAGVELLDWQHPHLNAVGALACRGPGERIVI